MATTATDRNKSFSGREYVLSWGDQRYGRTNYGGWRDVNNITDIEAKFQEDLFPIRNKELYDLFRVYTTQLYYLDIQIDEIYDNRFIDTARGRELELLGGNVGVPRKTGEPDDKYRIRVKAGFARASADTTFENFANIVLSVLQTDKSNVEITTPNPKVARIKTTSAVVDASPFTTEEIIEMLDESLEMDAKTEIEVQGSFSFDGPNVEDGTGWNEGTWTSRVE